MPYLTSDEFTVHIVVIEKETTGNVGNNGETSFKKVMMKMLPDADGTAASFTAGVNTDIIESYDMSTTFVEEMSDLAVAIFVQNNNTLEVFQAGFAIGVPSATFAPVDMATDVDPNTDITISFASAMRLADDSEITSGNIGDFVHLTDPSKADIPFTADIDAGKTVITITPDTYLPESTDITVSIDDVEIENEADMALAAASATFTTGAYPVANVVFAPADSETGVAYEANITLTFDDAMRKLDDSEIVDGDISGFVTLTDPSKGDVAYTGTINPEKTVITLDPDADIAPNTAITVTITGDAIENNYDMALALSTATFTTTDGSYVEDFGSKISIYPNPANEYIRITEAEGCVITVIDLVGKEVMIVSVNSNNELLNVSSLHNGTYFIKVSKDENVSLKKINIQR